MNAQTTPTQPRDQDTLPRFASTSALVRRIVMRLNAELGLRRHTLISAPEHAVMFDLGEASKILDGIAILPGMAVAEQRARRDLLELFEIFHPSPDPLEQTVEQPGHAILVDIAVQP